jgi:hypothetical protein
LIGIGQKLNILRNPPQTSSTPAAMMKKLLQPHPGQMPYDPDGPKSEPALPKKPPEPNDPSLMTLTPLMVNKPELT